MQKPFVIYVDRLKTGQTEKIEQEVSSSFLEIDEPELSFSPTTKISGEAYLANDHLVLTLKILTHAFLPCAICNEIVDVPIEIHGFSHIASLADLRSSAFDFSHIIREAILLSTPQFAECHEGKCPKREELQRFFKKKDPSQKEEMLDVQYPFSDLK